MLYRFTLFVIKLKIGPSGMCAHECCECNIECCGHLTRQHVLFLLFVHHLLFAHYLVFLSSKEDKAGLGTIGGEPFTNIFVGGHLANKPIEIIFYTA